MCQSLINKNKLSFHAVSPEFIKTSRIKSIEELQQIETCRRLPKLLKGDVARLKQVLMSLVKSSMKCTANGEIKILFAFHKEDNLIEVHVVDNGRGLAQSSQRLKLHEMLSSPPSDQKEMGSHMIDVGIMISTRLVQANHGTFRVHAGSHSKGFKVMFTMRAEPMNANDVTDPMQFPRKKFNHRSPKMNQSLMVDAAEEKGLLKSVSKPKTKKPNKAKEQQERSPERHNRINNDSVVSVNEIVLKVDD